jgi:oxaloacetate decarboxylase beta subunit
MPADGVAAISASQKLAFAAAVSMLLCLLFPVAALSFLSVFVGVAVRESGLVKFQGLLGETRCSPGSAGSWGATRSTSGTGVATTR